ncbi:YbaY family lipoprotein [Pseudomonas cremoricolorata]|uniref:YbaY family lipoprotein n=1 Tax=Pseudomonas cremoricolorata TaxID=157783 RepID=UPI00041F4C44|nr:YbaY family lipoprotein [Pseudomonas cremoricolorata]
MHPRALIVLCCAALLAACGSDRPKTPPAVAAPPEKVAVKKVDEPGPLPAWQRELNGSLENIPPGADVELALLVVDDKGRPQRLLASSNLTGTGQPLAYHLRFNPDAFPANARVELRGRASQSGQLILHMDSQRIAQAQTQTLAPVRFDKAP